jgi:hypothetical protein
VVHPSTPLPQPTLEGNADTMPFWLIFIVFLFWRALEAYCREERAKRD